MSLARSFGSSGIGERSTDIERFAGDASHYRALFEQSLEAILLTTPDGTILAANREACRLFDRDGGDLGGLPRPHYMDAADARGDAAWGMLQGTGRFAGLVTLRRGDGTRFEGDITATRFTDAAGTPLSYVVIRDVTERERAGRALLASEHRHRTLIEATGNVLIGLAPDGMILEWNREAERVYGYARREVLGKDFFERFVDPSRRELLRAAMARALAGEPQRTREETVSSRDGERRTLLWNVARLLDVDDRPVGVIASGQDITERKQLEAQMQHAQKLESLGVLAGGIAHDFNNLLVGILGNASLALMDIEETSPLHELVKDIETTALRAADLTKQMLAYSGRGRFVVRPVDLGALVEEMAHLLQTVISKRAVLRFDFARSLPEILADATQVRQIVMNLITNASDALQGGNGTVTLRTGIVHANAEYLRSPFLDYQPDEGAYAWVEVQDSGVGMSPETMQRIFDPFFSTKFTGRGLGLAATLGIVRAHRGTIRVSSAVGEGTKFRVLFPVRHAEGSAELPTPPDGAMVRGSGAVLVVDDDPMVRDVAAHILERRGFEVLTAIDGGEGLRIFAAARDRIVLAVIDLAMPVMGGEELIAAIRALSPDFPMILMSGFTEMEVATELAEEAIVGFVQKPFRVEELDRALQAALAR